MGCGRESRPGLTEVGSSRRHVKELSNLTADLPGSSLLELFPLFLVLSVHSQYFSVTKQALC